MDPQSGLPVIHIIANTPGPRLRYVADVIFSYILKLPYKWVNTPGELQSIEIPTISYGSQQSTPRSIFIPHTSFRRDDPPFFPTSHLKNNKKNLVFESHSEAIALSFDIFSASFALLARSEEHDSSSTDHHQRFPAASNRYISKKIARQPWVDKWAWELLEALRQNYSGYSWPTPSLQYQPTYDLDLPWKYLQRPVWRTLAASGRNVLKGNWTELKEQMAVVLGNKTDPYYIFDQLLERHQDNKTRPIFFIPVGKYGTYDKNIQPQKPAYRRLIRELAKVGDIGLHPSYQSFDRLELILQEKDTLEQITGSSISRSRQHYLRFRIPKTYQALLQQGISDEYSMGFAETIGFRAGTAYTYPWYNLHEERQTELLIHPFTIMDVSLHTYLQMPPEQALENMQSLARSMQLTGGNLITIWHNNSLEGSPPWQNWDVLYYQWLEWISKEV